MMIQEKNYPLSPWFFNRLKWPIHCGTESAVGSWQFMTPQDRAVPGASSAERRAAIRQSGPGQNRITEMRSIGGFGLEEVNLADVEGVRFLNACEATGYR